MLALGALAKLPWKFVAAWVAINALTYMVYGADKSSAKRGGWRTPEARLHLLALLGGWPAAAVAQQRLRHKASKGEFRAVFWVTVLVNCAMMIWLVTNGRALLAAFA